jgi:hypothetical protein
MNNLTEWRSAPGIGLIGISSEDRIPVGLLMTVDAVVLGADGEALRISGRLWQDRKLFATFASEDSGCQFKGNRSCLPDRREMIRR